MEDTKIIDLYWARDEKAIRETQRKYGRYCHTIAYNILHNDEDAEESVNDTYLGAWNSMPPHKPERLSAFLGKITRRLSLKKYRDKTAEKRGGGEVPLALDELLECIPDGMDFDEKLRAEELALLLDSFLRELPARERNVFLCRYWYFAPIKDICRRFGLGESGAKMMLSRTREKLLARLEKEEFFI